MNKWYSTLFNIKLFSYSDYDTYDDDTQFYDIEWEFDSMKKYNKYSVVRNLNGEIFIISECGEEIFKCFVTDILEFKNQF